VPCREDIESILAGRSPEKAPCGEFYIEPRLAIRILREKLHEPGHGESPLETMALASRELGLDYLCAHSSPYPDASWLGPHADDVAALVRHGFFVFAFADGGFGRLCREWGLERTLMFALNRPDEAGELVLELAREAIPYARRAMDLGAGALMLGEDFAYDGGLLISERLVREIIFPEIECWAETLAMPVVLHSDGDISLVAASLPETGATGVHSLEHALGKCHGVYTALGRRGMALLGGMPHPALQGDPARARNVRDAIIAAYSGLPFVFGSSAGVLDGGLCPRAVLDAYARVPGTE
jgi:hypothetical protein